MATTVASRKQKGRKLQQKIRDDILSLYPELTERDVVSAPMGVPGDDIQLSQIASDIFSYSIECKNTERINIWKDLDQSESNNRDLTPLLIFKRNRSDIYCCLTWSVFKNMIKENGELKKQIKEIKTANK